MATSCFNAFRLRKSKSKRISVPSSSKSHLNSDMENLEKKRFDSLESWSMILDSENVETWEVSKEDQEEWTADLSQLFIGNKFASGAHSRIYRGPFALSHSSPGALSFRSSIAHQMSFDPSKNITSLLRCDFGFMSRGRLWCSRKFLFRHWTWQLCPVSFSYFVFVFC